MKIIIAVHHFPPRYVSGAEKETLRVAKSLQRRGHAVQHTYLTITGPGWFTLANKCGCSINKPVQSFCKVLKQVLV